MPAGARVQVGDDRLEVHWIGPAPDEAPTLVFLHDGLGSASTWRDVPAALAAATGCGALVYSRSGYGGSTPRPGPWPVRFMHDEALIALPRLLAALAVRDGFLVGHSDGASISLIHAALLHSSHASAATASVPAATAGAASWRLRGMVLEAPHVFVEAVCLDSIRAMAQGYHTGDLARRMARHHGANAGACFAAWVEVWLRPEFRAWSIEALLARVRCPILVVQGEQDEYGTLAQLRAVASGCAADPAAAAPPETLVLADCGHTPHHQQRAAVLAATTRFVERWR